MQSASNRSEAAGTRACGVRTRRTRPSKGGSRIPRWSGGASDSHSMREDAKENSREDPHPPPPAKEKRKTSLTEKRRASLTSGVSKKIRQQFHVELPKELSSPLRDTYLNLSHLSSSIDDLLESPPDDVVAIDVPGDEGSFHSPAYAPHIMRYLKSREEQFALPTEPLHRSTSVRPSSRAVVVDWLIQVETHLDLDDECLHMTVGLLDRMLALRPVALTKVQLMGVACLFISTKLIERFAPSLRQLLRLTENAYSEEELKAAERLVLQTMKFDLHLPTHIPFMKRCIKASAHEMDKKKLVELHRMVAYILTHCTVDLKVMVLAPSLRAAAATWLARKLLLPPDLPVWTRTLVHYSTYDEEQMLPVVGRMAATLLKRTTVNYQAANNKYRSHREYGAMSVHPCLTQVDLLHRLASRAPEIGTALHKDVKRVKSSRI